MDASRDELDEHSVARRDCALDDLAFVGRSRNDGDATATTTLKLAA
jgi:hypothetical protein